MANQTGRPIAPARKLVAWIIGTIAVFVIALGLGMSSSPVAFFGVAVLVIAVAVAFMPAPRRGGRATVAGTAEVRSITPPPVAGAYGRATIGLIVVAPGLGAFEASVREPRIPVEKWPLPGATVPITVDVDDTRRVRVSWRDAPARMEGGDPPPPLQPDGRAEPDDLDDEVFGSVDEPWQGREDDWEVDPDGPGPASGPRGTTTTYARRTGTPVVVRETAAGTIVEGQVVDSDEEPSPLPRRARPLHPETAAPIAETTEPVEEPARAAPGAAPAASRTTTGPDTPRTAPTAPESTPGPSAGSHPDPGVFTSGPPDGPAPSAGPPAGAGSPSGSAAARPRGSRPSPRPRNASATATVERNAPSGTAEAAPATTTATQMSGTMPPAQRTSTESRTDPAVDIDLDLDLDGPATGPATAASSLPAQSTRSRTSASTEGPTGRPGPAEPNTGTQPVDAPPEESTANRATVLIDQVSPSGGPSERVSSSEDSPTVRTTTPIDPVSPAGWPPRTGSRGPGLTAPPPPSARPADAPPPPPSPVSRPRHAAPPPPSPVRAARPGPGTGKQSASGPAPAGPSPRHAYTPADATVPPAPAETAAARPVPESEPPRPDTEKEGEAPAAGTPGRHAASAVPPNVETRPLGSRTRFFAQPGEETESFETDGPEQSSTQPAPRSAQLRPEPIPSSAVPTPAPAAPPPTAPEPDRPFPSAPPPAGPRSGAPRPGIDQIDIPLDNFPLRGHPLPVDTNPEPAPEAGPRAAAARADDIVAPAAEEPPRTSALRDGILGVAVGRAAISPDAFPAPHLDDVPAPDAAQDQPSTSHEQDSDRGEQRRSGPWGDFNGRPDEHAGDVITGYPSARPASAGSIHGVGITVLVTDLERSTVFYRDILGFHEIDNGEDSAVLASGDTRLVLRTVHNLTSEADRLIYLNLEVGDIEAVHAELRQKGVKFIHSPRPVNRGDKLELWSATFRDPDNHNIAITQWRAIR